MDTKTVCMFMLLLGVALYGCRQTEKHCKVTDYVNRRQQIENELCSVGNKRLRQVLDSAERSGDSIRVMVACRILGKQSRDQSDFKSAFLYHIREQHLGEYFHDTLEIVRAYNNLGTDYRRIGAFIEGIKYHNQALEMCDAYSDTVSYAAKKNRTVSLNGIGNISLTLNLVDDAERCFREALHSEIQLKSYLGQAINFANIGSIFESKEQYDSAMCYYERSMRANELAQSSVGISLCYAYYGQIFEKTGRLQEALNAYRQSFAVINGDGDKWHWLTACIALARIELKLKTPEALSYLKQAQQVAEGIHSPEHLVEIYDLYYHYFKGKGDCKQALNAYELSRANHEKCLNNNRTNQCMEIRIEHEMARHRREMEVLEYRNNLQHIRQRHIMIIFVVLILIIIILLILSWRVSQLRHRRNKVLYEMNQTKNKFFSIIAHDLKNPSIALNNTLKAFMNSIDTLDRSTRNKYSEAIIQASDAQLDLLYSLLNWARLETGRIDFKPVYCDVLAIVQQVHKQLQSALDNKQIRLMVEHGRQTCAMADPNMIAVVLRNLISNAIKFSYSGSTIRVVFESLGDDLKISVIDTGIGMSSEVLAKCFSLGEQIVMSGTDGESGTGLGLLVCREMLKKHRTTLEVQTAVGKGCTFSFRLKK